MTDLAANVHELEYWRDGNGKPGAAAMIADHEKRITIVEEENKEQCKALSAIELHHAKEEYMIMSAVEKAMNNRGKSKEGIIRAFGPYVAAVTSLIGMIIVAILTGTAP